MVQLDTYNSGSYRKSAAGYEYFIPTKVNVPWSWDDVELNMLLEKAAIRLGELNSFSKLVPNIDRFIQLHVAKEAVVSSRIEGTKTNIDEVLMEEEDIAPERKNDWIEVNNYIKSLNKAIEQADLPISSRLIKQTHRMLLDSVRGERKLPGEFRTSQNWIGGNTLSDAIFIPPHHCHIEELMSDLENFIHNEGINVPDLVKIAITHYQFETIHPFLDGNGRIGRLLITLFMVEKKLLTKPLLYLSAYFLKNKRSYYDHLTAVRTHSHMKQWIKYFLRGVEETAEKASQTLSNILALKLSVEATINKDFGRKSQNATVLLQHLFTNPIITVTKTSDITNITYNTANALIADFVSAGILRELTGFSRNRVFLFSEYLDMF